MNEKQSTDRFWSVVDVPKTMAGALAAVCAAVVGSYLGVAGTLAGAAVASVVASVGTEVYNRSFRRGAQRLQTLAPTFVKAPAAIGTPPVAAATTADSPSHTVPLGDGSADDNGAPDESGQVVNAQAEGATGTAGAASASGTANTPGDETAGAAGTVYSAGAETSIWHRVRWSRVALVAGAVFVLAMGALTVTELLTGHSVASSVGNGTKAPTTLSGVFDPGSGPASPAPSPSPTPSAEQSTPTATPSTAPGSSVPSPTPSAATPSTVRPSPTTGAATTPPATVGLNQTKPGQTSGVTGP